MMTKIYRLLVITLLSSSLYSATYYLDSNLGNDAYNGLSESTPWKTINKVNQRNFTTGDQILFKRGQTFIGQINLTSDSGTTGQPILISAYGDAGLPRPIIDAGTNNRAIFLQLCEHIEIADLEITSGGIEITAWGNWNVPDVYNGYHLHDLYIHDVTTSTAISFIVGNTSNRSFSDITIENCVIEDIIGAGIAINKWAGTNNDGTPATPNAYYHKNLTLLNNTISRVNKAGIQIGKVDNALVKGNLTSNTGFNNANDGSGSGLWTWYTKNVLVEKNTFMGARGHTDSCGAHIDIGNEKNIFQYNLSIDNEGGFVELMGKNNGSIYRYNISINDGARIKGAASPGTNYGNALQYGNVFWLGGYTGQNGTREGPYYTYIYNNTIYTHSGISPNFQIENTAENALIANNALYLRENPTYNSNGPNLYDSSAQNNNLNYSNNLTWRDWRFNGLGDYFNGYDRNNGNPQYVNENGLSPGDYIPQNNNKIVDQSINISPLAGDTILTASDLSVTEDFFGNPIIGQPDIGAIESTIPLWFISQGMAGDSALLADSNGDGVSNLEAYAFDLNPLNNLSGNLPYDNLALNENSMDLEYYSNAPGVDYQTYVSDDLNTWTLIDSNQVSTMNASGYKTISIPTAVNSKKFLKFSLSIN